MDDCRRRTREYEIWEDKGYPSGGHPELAPGRARDREEGSLPREEDQERLGAPSDDDRKVKWFEGSGYIEPPAYEASKAFDGREST
jgi:hypothetical protein